MSKDVGKAVVRNRVRRLLKEIARGVLVKPGWDIVFIARKGISAVDYHQLEKSIVALLSRANLLADEDEMVCSGVD